jgi:hypothetical protein
MISSFDFQILACLHIVIFIIGIVSDNRRGMDRLYNLTIPISIAFIYSCLVQGFGALRFLAQDLDVFDLLIAQGYALLCHACIVLAYAFTPEFRGRRLVQSRAPDRRRLATAAQLAYSVGIIGYAIVVRQEGGLWAYFGSGERTGTFFDLSGYVYTMKFSLYGGIALFIWLDTLVGRFTYVRVLIGLGMLIICWDAVQSTDRGDTIRSGLMLIGWIYVSSRPKFRHERRPLAVYGLMSAIAMAIIAGVLLLPSFRDTGRKLTTSSVKLGEALANVSSGENKGTRSVTMGGEFESGARVIKRVVNGEIRPCGPVQYARVVWTAVPAFLIDDKWEKFDSWAGPDWQEVFVGSSSYYGCVTTGWGESYGTFGFLGGLIHWLLVGILIRKFEGWIYFPKTGVILNLLCYLGFLQWIMMGTWAFGMTFGITVLPVLVLVRFVQKKQADRRRLRRIYRKKLNHRGERRVEQDAQLIDHQSPDIHSAIGGMDHI